MTNFLKKAFNDMKESAAAQKEVSKAEFAAVKAESKAHFEENKFHNSLARAKAQGKQSWDDAHMSPEERAARTQKEREEKLAAANERIAAANERYEEARK